MYMYTVLKVMLLWVRFDYNSLCHMRFKLQSRTKGILLTSPAPRCYRGPHFQPTAKVRFSQAIRDPCCHISTTSGLVTVKVIFNPQPHVRERLSCTFSTPRTGAGIPSNLSGRRFKRDTYLQPFLLNLKQNLNRILSSPTESWKSNQPHFQATRLYANNSAGENLS